MTAAASNVRRRAATFARAGNARTYSPAASFGLLAPLAVLLLTIFALPIAMLLSQSLFDPGFTLEHYERLVDEPLYRDILFRTLKIAFVVTVIDLLIGYPLAYWMTRLSGWKAVIVGALVVLPLWTSVLVRSYAWTVLFQRNGIINSTLLALGLIDEPLRLLYTETAVLVAMSHVLLPFMVLPLYATLRGIPDDLPRAARSLGAGGSAVFREVVVPLSLPGVAAGALIVFTLALGFYVTPALVGGPQTLLIATLIGQQASQLLNWPFAGALSAVLLFLTIGIVFVFTRALSVERLVGDGT
jgi:mannopine transport system permease protein